LLEEHPQLHGANVHAIREHRWSRHWGKFDVASRPGCTAARRPRHAGGSAAASAGESCSIAKGCAMCLTPPRPCANGEPLFMRFSECLPRRYEGFPHVSSPI
jgi:hypothetical protein